MIVKSESNQLSLKRQVATGTIRYYCAISESFDKFKFALIASPQRSDKSDEINPVTFEIECILSENGAAKISQTVESLIEMFPDSENYFNKIESFTDTKWNNNKEQFLCFHAAAGINMTPDYLRKAFKLLEDMVQKVQQEIEDNHRSRSYCPIF
jgi:hypothetical protein